MHWRMIGQKTWVLLVLLAAIIGAALVAPRVVQTITPSQLAVAGDVITRIWWPVTAIRLLIYVLLAWGLYPIWVRGRMSASVAALTALPPAGVEPQADGDRVVYAAHLAHLHRAARRQRVVFGLWVGADLMIAQLPYWFLRG